MEPFWQETHPDYCDNPPDEDPLTSEDIAWVEGYVAVCEVVNLIRGLN